ncbi:helix-turn-helix transcriptional regulator [Parafilimonas sp.]|uniref:helix-turn-helix transcriptional regulator n=1 Tax=Parafilimonas sp. TaxID=1969739 RepID=UPI0039E509F3
MNNNTAHISIDALGYEALLITNEVPQALAEFHIPGSIVMSTVASFECFMLQLVELDGFNWLFSVFDVEKDVTLQVTYFVSLAMCEIVLKGKILYEIKDVENFSLKGNQFAIFCLQKPINIMHLQKGKYVSFEISCTQKHLLRILDFFPSFEKLRKNVLNSISSCFANKEMYLTASMTECIYKIIHSPYSSTVKQFHLNIVKDLFFKILQRASQFNIYSKRFTVDEIERIHTAKEFIDFNVPMHFTIPQIARRVGINDKKLKQGFKEIFGFGLYGYLQNRILEIAKMEVEQTIKSIQEIGLHAGYKKPNNFSSAFKKKFGVTPLEWRKLFNDNIK